MTAYSIAAWWVNDGFLEYLILVGAKHNDMALEYQHFT